MSAIFQWIEQSWLGTAVNNSLWAFAAFEAVHLLALAVIVLGPSRVLCPESLLRAPVLRVYRPYTGKPRTKD